MNSAERLERPEFYPELIIRRSEERGHFDHDWLDTYHSFSFADYHDPRFMGFRDLRVINEDRVQPGKGFPMHGHRDMEIVTYVLEGELTHEDTLGNRSVIRAGEFQRMTAGAGILHSEQNAGTRLLHLFQIWIVPEAEELVPGYEQKAFPKEERTGNFRLVASHDGRAGSLKINQDVDLFSAILEPGEAIEDRLAPDRYGWAQVVRGVLTVNGEVLRAGDAAALVGGGWIEVKAPVGGENAELLLFDLS